VLNFEAVVLLSDRSFPTWQLPHSPQVKNHCSRHFAFSSQRQSDKTFPKHISKSPNCANPPCVRSHEEGSFSQLKLIKSHHHVAREVGGTSQVSVESETSLMKDIVSQFAKKDWEGIKF